MVSLDNRKTTKSTTGFTLLELLVVIAIIGVLAAVVLASLNIAGARARDTQRLADMRTIQSALQLYYNEHGQYPNEEGSSWEYSDEDNGEFLEILVTEGYLPTYVVDPVNDSTAYRYRYYRYSPGEYSCDVSQGYYYVLGVNNFEASSGAHPKSPGWQCPGRNWQVADTEWVTGAFE